jgi:hypothetical protein
MAGTAAGVIAGGFLFQGIEHLLDRQGSTSGRMNGLSNELSADRHDITGINPDFPLVQFPMEAISATL